jgi:hypothetical protein
MSESLENPERLQALIVFEYLSNAFVAVHEAGHAVTAAHLSVPFIDVTARRNKPDDLNGLVRFPVDSDSTTLAKRCVISMASRPAVDAWMIGAGITLTELAEFSGKSLSDLEQWMERTYRLDEDALCYLGKTLYGLGPSGQEFTTWRAQVVKEAQDIVALPKYIEPSLRLPND